MTSLRRLANVILTVIAFLTVGMTSNKSAANATTNFVLNDALTVSQSREEDWKQSLTKDALPQPQYVTMVITAYTANDEGMNGRAVTASGEVATPWKTVAASTAWPIGTTFRTPDGETWVVEDRGGSIKANDRLDLYVGEHDTSTALSWGVRTLRLEIIRYGGGDSSY